MAGLRGEAAAIRTNLDEMAVAAALGKMDKAQMYAASAAGARRGWRKARLAQIDEQLRAATVDSPLIGVDDVAAAWDAQPLPRQRLIVNTLVTVTILPAGHRGRGFCPDTVRIVWNTVPQGSYKP